MAILFFIFILEILVFLFYLKTIVRDKVVFDKKNLLYMFPLLIIIYVIYLYALKDSLASYTIIDYIRLLNLSLKSFLFDYDGTILGAAIKGNVFFLILVIIQIIITLFTTFTLVVSFIFFSIETYNHTLKLRKSGFDVVMGMGAEEIDYFKNNKNTILQVDSLDNITRKSLVDRKVYFIKANYDKKGFLKIVRKSNKRINFIYLGDDYLNKLNYLNEFTDFINENNKYLDRVYLYINIDRKEKEFFDNIYGIKNSSSPRIISFNKSELVSLLFIKNNPLAKYISNDDINFANGSIREDIDVIYIGLGKVNKEIFLKQFVNEVYLDEKLNEKKVNFYGYDIRSSADLNLNLAISNFELGDSNDYFDKLEVNNLKIEKMNAYDGEFYRHVLKTINKSHNVFFVVSLSDDSESIDVSYKLSRLLKEREFTKFKIFTQFKNSKEVKNLVIDNKLVLFGANNDILSHEVIVDEKLNDLAIHRSGSYQKLNDKNLNGLNLYEWNCLDSLKRNSNISSSNSIFAKLLLIGLEARLSEEKGLTKEEYLRYLGFNDDYDYLTYDFKNPSKLNVLAILEHLRWNNFYISEGYRPLEKSKIELLIKNGSYKFYKEDNITHKHACLTSITGLDKYHRLLADKLYSSELKNNYASYEDCLRSVETFKYDYDLMVKAYDYLTSAGYNIYHRGSYFKIINEKNIDVIYRSYLGDFPKEERLDYQVLTKHLKSGKYRLYVGLKDEIVCYLLGYSENKKFIFMDYLATLTRFRSTGVGKVFLKKMLEEFDVIVFEVEISDGVIGSQTDRREKFYTSLGAKKVDIPYELPTEDGSMPMNLFTLSNKEVDNKKLKDFVVKAVSFIHQDKKHLKSVINKYIDKF